jgi:hypothetical protein
VLAGNVASVLVSDTEPRMSGYLSRRSNEIWVKNWYVLKDKVLYIYHNPNESDPLDVLPVRGYFVESVDKVLNIF